MAVAMGAMWRYLGSVRLVRALLWARLGGCLCCTRSALRTALIAWGMSGVVQAVGAYGFFPNLIGTGAFALTALWLTHLFAHAARASRRGSVDRNQFGLSRRAIFVRALASVAVVTATPRLVFGQCSDES